MSFENYAQFNMEFSGKNSSDKPKRNRKRCAVTSSTSLKLIGSTLHLRLQNRKLAGIPSLSKHNQMKVLYLYGNNLSKIENLEPLTKLTHLYLNNNKITRISCLESLHCLEKLYLGYNRISVVEGMDTLRSLSELQLQGQHLDPGESLAFDPRSVESMAASLSFLNISNNNIESLQAVRPLRALRHLVCSENLLTSVDDVADTVACLPLLATVDLTGNPVCRQRRFRDTLVERSGSELVSLNGVTVTDVFRLFVQGRQRALATAAEQKQNAKSNQCNTVTDSAYVPQSDDATQSQLHDSHSLPMALDYGDTVRHNNCSEHRLTNCVRGHYSGAANNRSDTELQNKNSVNNGFECLRSHVSTGSITIRPAIIQRWSKNRVGAKVSQTGITDQTNNDAKLSSITLP